MNVCLLNDSFPPVIDGVANAVVNYAERINSREDAQVMVATPEYPDVDYSVYPYKVCAYKSYDTTSIIKGYRAGNPLTLSTINEVKHFAPDIIHSHCPVASTLLARILRKETDAPIVFTYHTKFDIDIAHATKNDFLQKESVRAIVANISACDEVWTVSRGAGENLCSLGYEGEYIVMPNGVDFDKGRAEDTLINETAGGYDLPEGIPMFLFVGRIMKYKGLPIIIDALKRLSEEGTDYRMVFVGSGADTDEIKNTVKEYGISLDERENDGSITHTEGSLSAGKVIFVGPVFERDILKAWNSRADLFLFPSTYDTNGIVVREAAACGLASVLIKGSCAAEDITDGENGFTIEENADSMYELLSQLIKEPSRMKQIGENAMEQIYISWDDSVKAAYERYNVILEKNKVNGIIGKKKSLTDMIADKAAELMDTFHHAVQAPKHIDKMFYRNIFDNIYGMQDNSAEAEKFYSERDIFFDKMESYFIGKSEQVKREFFKRFNKH